VCVYEAGLDTFSEEFQGLGLTTLAFRASDPYWQDSVEQSLVATINTTSFTWFPFLPLVLGASDVFAGATINNSGDVDAWPIITAVGPGTGLTVTNVTTGLAWTFTGAMGDTDRLVVDTRPGHKSVKLNGGNQFARLSDPSVLWPLVPGYNRISIGFAGATIATSVTFAWRHRWLAA
jgi:phage-related protein